MTSDPCVGVHKINDDVINTLKQKHPKPSLILENSLFNDSLNEVLPCYFDNIDEEMVSKASSLTKGAGGPSQTRCNAISSLVIKPQIQDWKQGTQNTNNYFG